MPHATATFNGKVIAEADKWEFVEGNVYFPPDSVDKSVLSDSTLTTFCPWKGTASYYNISVDGQGAKDAAWYYPSPKTDKASPLKDHVAFYKTKVDVKSE
ncbi:hypothetical protein JMJ35_008967 [Cladonia borealis]|uniref:DUF427 domain-containing protein n=1 Tax=Cladonia borealis TaxID=184061 RepID=A0AA39U697_9LECA|nr:hypothetical protein JMJ35_008967 [Cladonia borealis]